MVRWIFARVRNVIGRVNGLPPGLKVGLIVVVLAVVSVGAYGGGRFYDYSQNDPSFCRSCHTMEKAWQRWNTSEHSKVNCHSCHISDPVADMQQVFVYAMKKPDKVEKHARVSDDACKSCHESGNSDWRQVAETVGHQIHNEDEGISCVKCHSVTLHRFKPPKDLCKACHEEKAIKISQMADRYCLDCHNFLRESSPLRPTRETCLSCHQKLPQVRVTWPDNAPMKFVCSDCHKPHVQQSPVANCTSCHSNVKAQGLHKGVSHTAASCQTCHKPHEWKVTTRAVCESCHTNKVGHNQGLVCKDCHDFKKAG